MSVRIRIDDDVARELRRRHLATDTSWYNDPLRRALEEADLRVRLRVTGLGPKANARLYELEWLRENPDPPGPVGRRT